MLGHWFNKDFKPYAKRQGLQLLRDDIKFIESRLQRLPEYKQREALRQYVKEWDLSLGQNQGRFKANQYLLNHT